MRNGIDISFWQGDVNFEKVKASGVDFVILREGYRATVDKMFFKYVKKAKKAKLDIDGVYHFIYATNEFDARLEARACIENVKKARLPKSTIIWADLEYDTVKKARENGIELTPQMQRDITVAFCEEVQSFLYPVGIYCNQDYLYNIFGSDIADKYDIWLAQYGDANAKPVHKCLYRQTSESGRVNGIQGKVDTDQYIGEYTAYTAKAQKSEKKKKDEKTIDELAMDVINGVYGNGEARKNALGDKYEAVQKRVNEILDQAAHEIAVDSDRRDKFVAMMRSWVGKNEDDGSHRLIVDTYNNGLPTAVDRWGTRNVKMQYDWPWCACTVSAAAMASGCSDIVPIEISCPYMVQIAKYHGIWVEDDGYVPSPGDIILYDWEDNGIGDNEGTPDHVGVVESVNGDVFTVIEGNMNDGVGRRTLTVDGRYIRGYVVPKF